MIGEGLLKLKAHEFPKDFTWLNTKEPIPLEKLKGHVVLLDFWTYCCINCIHIMPTLAKLEEKYEGKPFVIIGVHSPKFKNEQKPENVQEAINRYELKHPVIVDKGMKIWKEYGASAWPTLVIIDPKGRVVYKQPGERQFFELDSVIAELLERGEDEGTLARTPIKINRPEIKDKRVLSYPGKMSFSPDSDKFALSDSNHNRILIVNTKSGKILERIGSGEKGLGDGDFSKATFNRPQGVLWLKDKIYVADTENHALREIDIKKRTVRRLAGTGEQSPFVGFAPLMGEGIVTALSSPWDLAEKEGRVYIAMAGLHQIWGCEPKSGVVYPFAGGGAEGIVDGDLQHSKFSQPSGLAFSDGRLYVADSEDSGIRSIDLEKKYVSTLVGTGLFVFGFKDGSLYEAKFQHPIGITSDGNKLYVADTYNSAIRLIDLGKETVKTVVGVPGEKSMCRFDDPNCDTLGLYEPNDVKVLGDKLYIVDTNNHLVRIFDMKSMMLKTLNIKE